MSIEASADEKPKVDCQGDFGTAKSAIQLNVAHNKEVKVVLINKVRKYRSPEKRKVLEERRAKRKPRKVKRSPPSATTDDSQAPLLPFQSLQPVIKYEQLEGQVEEIRSNGE